MTHNSTEEPSRKEIWTMFNQISSTYDRVNRVMTFGLDHYWRKRLSSHLPVKNNLNILDCATGTCDQIISLMENGNNITNIVGLDLADEMIAVGLKKIETKKYKHLVSLHVASALEIPFPNNTFDCITISFGIRNVTDVSKALTEFFRVLKPGGRVLILEGTIPHNPLLKTLHLFYLRYFLPRIGAVISKKREAYRYLNKTIETFPSGAAFLELMHSANFKDLLEDRLTFGAVTVYRGDK